MLGLFALIFLYQSLYCMTVDWVLSDCSSALLMDAPSKLQECIHMERERGFEQHSPAGLCSIWAIPVLFRDSRGEFVTRVAYVSGCSSPSIHLYLWTSIVLTLNPISTQFKKRKKGRVGEREGKKDGKEERWKGKEGGKNQWYLEAMYWQLFLS